MVSSRRSRADIEGIIRRIAERQCGLVTRSQLLEQGLSGNTIDRLVKTGRLTCVLRGVYQTGTVHHPRAREWAAILACGKNAVISHVSAAVLWGLLRVKADALVDVTLGVDDRRRIDGLRVHRMNLTRHEKTRIEGIPVTTVERTLLDIAAIVTTAQLEKAIAEAYARNLTRPARLKRMIDRNPGRRGIERLRYFVESDVMPARTNSPAEARCLALIRRGGLPEPEVNVMVEGKERDFYWPSHGLVLEVDGYQYHQGRPKFEQDRWRDSDLVAAKIRVLHTTWRRITEQPEAVAILLAQALGNA